MLYFLSDGESVDLEKIQKEVFPDINKDEMMYLGLLSFLSNADSVGLGKERDELVEMMRGALL